MKIKSNFHLDGPVFGPVINGTQKLLTFMSGKMQLQTATLQEQMASLGKKVQSMEQDNKSENQDKTLKLLDNFEGYGRKLHFWLRRLKP